MHKKLSVFGVYVLTLIIVALTLIGIEARFSASVTIAQLGITLGIIIAVLIVKRAPASVGLMKVDLESVLIMATCISLPLPLPALIGFAAVGLTELKSSSARSKRVFNVAQITIQTAMASAVFNYLRPPGPVNSHSGLEFTVAAAAAVLVDVVLNIWMLHAAISLLDNKRTLWKWQWFADRVFISTGAGNTVGVTAAVLLQWSPFLTIFLVLPLIQIRETQRAQEREHDRADAVARQKRDLSRIIEAGQVIDLEQTHEPFAIRSYATVARSISEGHFVRAYLPSEQEDGAYDKAFGDGDSDSLPNRVTLAVVASHGDPNVLWLPLGRSRDLPRGFLALGLSAAVNDEQMDALEVLATQATLAIANTDAYRRIADQVQLDGLTGLPNHRGFHTKLQAALARTTQDAPTAVLLVDLDRFASVNEAGDWATGDAALVRVGRVLHRFRPVEGIVARYSGDEFAVLLPHTTTDAALAIGRQICKAIATVRDPSAESTVLTASIGLAVAFDELPTSDDVVTDARRAMRAARVTGGDGVATVEDADRNLIDLDPRTVTEQLARANMDAVKAFAAAVDAKDPYTQGHSRRVAAYSIALARTSGYDDQGLDRIHLAGLLHDVGKIAVPDAVLLKPDRLTPEEYAEVKKHPAKGFDMLKQLGFIDPSILPAVRSHHERWDGGGYPDGISGYDIHPDAALMAVADSFDAMCSDRPYRKGMDVSEAIARIHQATGTQFSPDAVAAFDSALACGTLRLLDADEALSDEAGPSRLADAS